MPRSARSPCAASSTAKPLSGNTRVRDKDATSSDWNVDQPLLDRSGNAEIRLALFHRYGSNASLYPKWQAYIRTHQPPALAVWGENDPIFPAAGAKPQEDLG